MITKRKNNISYLCIIAVILQNISVFFSDIVQYITIIQFMCLILYLIYMLIYRINLRVYKPLIMWLMYLFVVFINIFIGGDEYFVLSFLLINFVMILTLSIDNLGIFEYKIVKLFCEIHLFCSLIVYILPHYLYDGIFAFLLGNNASSNYSWRVISNMNAGITTQPGINAIYLSLLVMICAVEIIEKKGNSMLNIVLLLLSFMMVVSTGKRSAIILTILVITLYFCCFKFTKVKSFKVIDLLKAIVLAFFIGVFGYWLINKSLAVQTLILKANQLAKMGDISNGRFELWNYAIDKWLANPIMGIGFKQIQKLTGLDVHNTYFQILAETGLIGFLVFIISIILILNYAYKKVKVSQHFQNIDEKCCTSFGFMLILFLLIYGLLGNTFIDYLPVMLFSMAILLNYNSKEERI